MRKTEVILVIVGVLLVSAVYAQLTCNSGNFDSSNSYFIIKNNANEEIVKIDQNGMMVITGELKSWSTGYDNTHDFLIKNNAGTVKSWIDDSTGDLYLSGSLFEEATAYGMVPSSSGNFVIMDSGGNSVAWFKDNGELYLGSCLALI